VPELVKRAVMSRRFALLSVVSFAFVAFASSAAGCSGNNPTKPALSSDGGRDSPVATPVLIRLSVEGSSDASPPMVLVPPFSPDAHDYYVRCAEGANAMTVSMTASLNSSSFLREPTTSVLASEQTLQMSVVENQAIVAVATNGLVQTEYWIRCLPHDMPAMRMIGHPGVGTPSPGYYLVGTFLQGEWQEAGIAGYAMVLNGNGVPVWYTRQIDGATVYDVDDVVFGAISFFGYRNGPPGQFEFHYLEPASTSYVGPAATWISPHDLQAVPGGFLTLTITSKQGVDLSGLSVTLPNGKTEAMGSSSTIWDCGIAEFDGYGVVQWTWDAFEHIDPRLESVAPEYAGQESSGATIVDPFHCNSIDIDPTGNILLSGRDMNALFYIQRSSGKILWKMGGTSYSKDEAVYVSVADPFDKQHDARFQPGWSATCSGGHGQISLFDDESDTAMPARGILYDVNVAASDCAATDAGASRAMVVRQYPGSSSSIALGSFRISSDGSQVICWGATSTPGLVFTEVDRKGDDLLDFEFTDGFAQSYRVVKTPLTAFDLGALRNAVGP
jgi:Arylsulfotransferase (ASST)